MRRLTGSPGPQGAAGDTDGASEDRDGDDGGIDDDSDGDEGGGDDDSDEGGGDGGRDGDRNRDLGDQADGESGTVAADDAGCRRPRRLPMVRFLGTRPAAAIAATIGWPIASTTSCGCGW